MVYQSNPKSAEINVEMAGALFRQVVNGHAYKVSRTTDLDSGEEYIIHFENPPVEEWESDNPRDLNIEPISLVTEDGTVIEAYKDAEPQEGFAGNLPIIANGNYAYDALPPDVIIEEDTTGDFATDFELATELPQDGKSEEGATPRDQPGEFLSGKAPNRRGLFRVIPPGESVTVIVESQNPGNRVSLNTTVYLHSFRDDGEDSTTGTW